MSKKTIHCTKCKQTFAKKSKGKASTSEGVCPKCKGE